MKGLLLAILLGACSRVPPAIFQDAVVSDTLSTVIAFGSCNREDLPQPLWPVIARHQPDVFVWLGDDIYGDSDDMRIMRAKYAQQLANPGYRDFTSRVPIVGTWDDHDYGLNNGGKEFTARAESQQAHLDFLGEPASSARRKQAGIHASYTYGQAGRRIKLILLDTRYHRDSIGSNGTILGEEQWRWLEKELRESDAQINLIGSGIQVLAEDHRFEKWSNFPAERERLLGLIAETRAPGVIFLSGDRHIAEVSVVEDPRIGYPIVDVTSSGLTHTSPPRSEKNRHRSGPIVFDLNYGLVVADWKQEVVRLQVRGEDGLLIERVVPFADLR